MNFLKSVAAHFGVSFVKLGTLINLSTKKIGYHSTCEVFSFYNKNYTELSNDEELKKFLDFYIENWQYSYSQTSQDIFVMFITNMKKKWKLFRNWRCRWFPEFQYHFFKQTSELEGSFGRT